MFDPHKRHFRLQMYLTMSLVFPWLVPFFVTESNLRVNIDTFSFHLDFSFLSFSLNHLRPVLNDRQQLFTSLSWVWSKKGRFNFLWPVIFSCSTGNFFTVFSCLFSPSITCWLIEVIEDFSTQLKRQETKSCTKTVVWVKEDLFRFTRCMRFK